MSTTVTIHPTTPSGSCPFADLPHELMTEVFLHLDPHTLYTSIRQLNRDWKETVETHIIPMAFKSGKWRLALRIHQRPRKATPEQQQFLPRVDPSESSEQRRTRVESTLGAWEDELDHQQPEQTTTAYLPLELEKVNPAADRFEFSTGTNWYAIYELSDGQPDSSFRLDLDFGVAWRFEGDGKDEEEQRPGGWTKLDQENGWLSKFYCSGYDLSNAGLGQQHSGADETYKLHATPLTRRRRLPSRGGNARHLDWDDSHLEYFHLHLCLGTEFFVRRSARANLLMRALEAEAARREAAASGTMDDASPPASRVLHRPLAQKATLAAHSHRHLMATPPPSRSSPPGQQQLRSDMTPAEQLQMLAKSKAAARAAGGGGAGGSNNSKRLPGWARNSNGNSKRTVSQPVSRNASQPSSLAPSRVVSRAPTRPGSPANDDSEPLEQLNDTPPRLNTSRFNTPAIPGTPVASPRDMPFFRAQALSLSTASPFTHRALSGYTTPNAGSAGTNSFALRGGGGAEPGGTPFAEFKARLRRAKGFAAAPDPDERRRRRAESISSIATLRVGAATNDTSSSSTWNKTQDTKLDGQGVTREWRWARVCGGGGDGGEAGSDESDSPLETEWSWSR